MRGLIKGRKPFLGLMLLAVLAFLLPVFKGGGAGWEEAAEDAAEEAAEEAPEEAAPEEPNKRCSQSSRLPWVLTPIRARLPVRAAEQRRSRRRVIFIEVHLSFAMGYKTGRRALRVYLRSQTC